MNKKSSLPSYLFSGAGVVIMFLLLVSIYVISGVVKHRVDLTADRIYTLSKGTSAILAKLDTPVEIRFYCSQRVNAMPVFLKTYAQRVEDLLNEYRKNSNGKITLKKFDPEPDSDAEDSAGLDGVEGQMLNTGEKIFMGIAVSCLDTKTSLPFLTPDREKLLEYDLSRAISQVTVPEKPVVGVMSPLPIFGMMNPMMMQMGGGRQEPWVLVGELKKDYTVRQVEMTADKIDDDIKVLVVVYPREITDKAQYAIDQFVLRGGKLIAFVDPLFYFDDRGGQSNPMQRNMNSGASLEKLFKAWGVEFDKAKVIADLNFATKLNQNGRAVSAPAVLSLTTDAVDTNDVATSQIDNMVVPFAGVFTGTPADGLKKTVLLKTTPQSQLIEKMMAEFSGDQTAKDFVASGKEQAVAIRLVGKFKTAFPDGKPKDAADGKKEDKKEEKPDSQPALKESKTDGVVVLVGDCDMLYDQVCVSVQNFLGQRVVMRQNQNLDFVQNVVDQLAGDSNLIGVRSRATMSRPFTLVKKMQTEAEGRYRDKIKELEKSLTDTQQKLNDMQAKKEGGQRFIISPEQQTAIQQFRKDEARVKRELKKERKNLRQDIESLQTRLEWVNIAGMPCLVTVAGLMLAILKRQKTAAK
jgi:ABC-type uncharacterized transport system involved in gliding motility auxiliary subunit